MKCLRCGYCCIETFGVLPDGSSRVGTECKYLVWNEDGTTTCTIHGKAVDITDEDGEVYHYEWDETPCGRHNAGWGDRDCRMGAYVLAKGGYHKFRQKKRQVGET